VPLVLPAPAKLNLFLEVLGRRPDGYHELRTVMAPVSLFDRLEIRAARAGTRVTFDPPLPPGPDTVTRAVAELRRAAGWRGGVRLHVAKRIPLGAGLGGGSADGAAALVGVNRLMKLGLDRARLAELAARVGSDVPFFLAGGPALCAGRGERVTPLTIRWPSRFLLAMPPCSISTAELYRRLGPELSGPRRPVERFLADLAARRWRPFNRLEAPAFRLQPAVRRLRRALGPGALMTGSGAACFAPAPRPLSRRPESVRLWRVRLLRSIPGWDA
jgi:4-diphosphocytidyl-2-C-methyl-D-erythritol kinase